MLPFQEKMEASAQQPGCRSSSTVGYMGEHDFDGFVHPSENIDTCIGLVTPQNTGSEAMLL
jgi:hypothetical protein